MSGPIISSVPPDGDVDVTRGFAAQLTHLAQLLSADGEVGTDQITAATLDLVVDVLPFVHWASLTELVPPQLLPATSAANGEVARAADECQYEARQGPCLQALADGEVVTTDDVRQDGRWPGMAGRLSPDSPVRAVRSYPLAATCGVQASLNLYSEEPAAFRGRRRQSANVLSALTALVLAGTGARQHGDRLTTALADDRQVSTAMGVLMGRHGWSREEAFSALRGRVADGDSSARDVAAHVISTGDLPG